MIQNNLIKIAALAALFGIVFSGCSGGKDGLDMNSSKGVPITHGPLNKETGYYRCNYPEDAIKVEKGSVVEPKTKDTEIRIWHFPTSDKYVCLRKGEAYIK